MKGRLAKLIENENTSPARLAEKIGVQPSAISHILSGRNKPGFDFIANLLRSFPTIDPKWLLLGQGEMYYGEAGREKIEDPIHANKEKAEFTAEYVNNPAPLITNVTKKEGESLNEIPSVALSGEAHAVDESNSESPKHKTLLDRKPAIERVMVFYSDKSFEEYRND